MQTQLKAARRFDAYLRGADGNSDNEAAQKPDSAADLKKSCHNNGRSTKAEGKQSEQIEHAETIGRALQKAAEVSKTSKL